jgi:hypothetical protein
VDRKVLLGALLWNPTADNFPLNQRGTNVSLVSLENNAAMPLLLAAAAAAPLSARDCWRMATGGTAGAHGASWPQALCSAPQPFASRLGPLLPAFGSELYKPTQMGSLGGAEAAGPRAQPLRCPATPRRRRRAIRLAQHPLLY